MKIPAAPLDKTSQRDALTRPERADLGRSLRRLGLSYGEICQVIPVPKGTLSYWLRDVHLSLDQKHAIKARTNGRRGLPRDTQWRRREEIARIRSDATREAIRRIKDPLFIAGVVLYWGEGSKTGNELSLANSDPRLARLFIDWVRRYHDAHAEFVLKLNLHANNNDAAAKDFWRRETHYQRLPSTRPSSRLTAPAIARTTCRTGCVS